MTSQPAASAPSIGSTRGGRNPKDENECSGGTCGDSARERERPLEAVLRAVGRRVEPLLDRPPMGRSRREGTTRASRRSDRGKADQRIRHRSARDDHPARPRAPPPDLSSHGSQSGKSAIEGLRSTTTTILTVSSAKWSRTTNSSVPRAADRRADAAQSIRRTDVAQAIRTRAGDLAPPTPRRRLGAARDVERTARCGAGIKREDEIGLPGSWSAGATRRQPSRDAVRARRNARAARPARPASRRRARRCG